ncbi:lithostathine-1-beta-like [Phascolarctos cinereus]
MRVQCFSGSQGLLYFYRHNAVSPASAGFSCAARCSQIWSWLNCQSLPSGHLLSLMNESEAAFVAALATQSLGENRSHLWIGLHDPSQNICWRWSDNATLTLVTWEKGAPTKTTLKFCVSLSPRSGFLQWKNQHCNEELPFICKFSA